MNAIVDTALHRVLAVDDDPDVAAMLELSLVDLGGFDARICLTPDAATSACHELRPQLIIMDAQVGSTDGVGLVEKLRALVDPTPTWVLLTGSLAPELQARARAAGALETLEKPFDVSGLAPWLRERFLASST